MADALTQHLLRRAGFGASAADLAVFAELSYSQAVDRLVDYEALADTVDANIGKPGYVGTTSNGPFSPNTVVRDARQRWLFRMLHTDRPLQEKMALFWHNYFATGYSKVAGAVKGENGTRLMAARPSEDPVQQKGQIELFRERALGNFRDLLIEVAKDPAMLIWLDGISNTKAKPQENFGRELMELFTRGVGYYTEEDVYAAARVFTGWNLNRPGRTDTTPKYEFVYNAGQHDTDAKTFSFPIYGGGSKTIPARSASAGMQDGLDLIAALAFHPETARRLAGKLYAFFVSETTTDDGFVDELAQVYLQNGTELKPVVRHLLKAPQFQSVGSYFSRYSWPVDFVVRAMKEAGWVGFSVGSVLSPLVNMGQELFEPPDVAGWSLGPAWFSTSGMLARMNLAATLAANQKFILAQDAVVAKSNPEALVSYMLTRLTPADLDPSTMSDLVAYAGAGVTWTGSTAQLQAKASGLAHLILGSAEYQFM
jgi:uncharacterized protein (DUF1800 family)